MKPFFLRLLFFVIPFFFFFFSLTLSVSSLSASPHPDLLVLLSLKSSLRGHAALADWNATTASFSGQWPAWCGWSGVKCDPGTRNIVSLDLSSRNLSGQVPAAIRYLSHLTELNLSRNSLGGAIPGEIFELASLRTLDISRNNFNSTFPAGISNLRFLTFFDAYNNNLTGTLPEEISRLRFLEWLNLGGSGFHGGAVTSYGGLKNLKFLKLAGCGLNGSIPPELGLLTRLEQLEIGYNSFEGGVPPELALAKNLTYLDISSGGLSGPIAPELGNLTNLQTLLLFNNRFSGEIPRSFGNLRAMRNIDLSGNLLTGQIPEEFSSMKELVGLNLMLNQLSGKVPEGIADLPNLQYFYLWNNSLTGSLPQNLGLNAKLMKFDVSSNSLSGPIPPSLCAGDALDKIILFGNQFSGGIPPSLANCAALARIRIQKNRLNGSIPYGFGRLRNLTFMDISDNDLSGAIPGDLATGQRLQFLNISGNAFGTKLPENIWSAPSLQIFSASACNLIGRIPKFSGCRSLYKIELAGNSLNGSIPGDVDSCEKLISLNLHRNSLTGGIPWELSALPSIADVDLSHNSLSGAIPPNFSNCNTVENFNVSFNRLTGPIPATCTIFSNLHPSSFAGNEALCGGNLLKPCDSVAAPAVPKEKKPRKTAGKILWIMAAAFGVGLFVLVAGSQWLRSHGFSLGGSAGIRHAKSAAGPWKLTAFQRLNFTAEDVADCTSAAEGIIGMGTQGTVYRAEMPGGEIIAVKKLWGQNKESTIRKRKGGVLAEVDVLGHVRHRNVVRMIGYCGNSECTMLLYEYMPNGSLDDLLHGKSKGQRNLVADWVTRYKIALGVAQGICYLHHDCDPVIVHRDLKPSNILLDGEMEARVADFGVAKLIQSDEAMSVVAGSYGYIAPEYTYTLQVDEKSDIYSYGVVLMEILTGKRCSDAAFGEGNSIVDWIRSKIKTKEGLSDVLDKNAGASCDSVREEMILVLRVALLCTSRNPADRPSMRDVVSMLHEAKPQRKLPESMDFVGTVNPVIGVNGGGDGGDGSSPLVHRASILDC